MNDMTKPAIWLLLLIVALPQLSETIYSPVLPEIAQALHVSHRLVEYTLTIFLLGLALGIFFWGKLSDKYGRKPVLVIGMLLYVLGSIGCFFSTTITALMISRFVQAFGGSVGSVIGQVICRDAFHGQQRNIVFSTITMGLQISPAVGPMIGGCLGQFFGWRSVFVFLILLTMVIVTCVIARLPETYKPQQFSLQVFLDTVRLMIQDRMVLGLGFVVAGCNGITFSYFAEGPFCLISYLKMSPSTYGMTFVVLAAAGIVGSLISQMANRKSIDVCTIIQTGLTVIILGAVVQLGCVVGASYKLLGDSAVIVGIVLSMAIMMCGITMTIPNILAQALQKYGHAIGTASSLFGGYYYCLISLYTLGMGLLHNHTLWPMPIYFLAIAITQYIVFGRVRKFMIA